MASRAKSRAQTGRERHSFTVNVRLYTGEIFPLKNISGDMKISDLKQYMEFATGIPIHMQRISYLDDGDLLDKSDIRSNDIVPNATLNLNVWPMWKELIDAASSNDADWVFSLGVTNPTTYKTPQSDYMTKRARKIWLEERAFLALFIAAHRGHDKLVQQLIDCGADVNACTPLGRTALHVAAAQGRGHIVDVLLEKGADIDAEDEDGATALSIAAKFGHKSCERHLFLFRWQERAKRIQKSDDPDRMAHQYFDSAFPVWMKGGQCQLYFTNILPPGEYEGTGLCSPLKRPTSSSMPGAGYYRNGSDEDFETDADGAYIPKGGMRLPAIREERAKKSGKKQISYKDWLGKKTSVEQKVIDAKKKEEDKKRLEEEDQKDLEKRMEAEKSQSYETWLAQREKEKTTSDNLPPRTTKEPAPPVHVDKGPGYLRSYLRSLGKTKTGDTYEDWLNHKEKQLGLAKSPGRPNSKMPVSTY
ncbi:uncharacterized protein LOC110443733 isoform X2 [Mizuhopecten yessoensis]|uniref:uncharacterized protein LOC110443733 isoform X2 n=1 Tax=Mizuhopecten yessoensis TaxID=6573 RepID=UPI000B45BF8D|nr:uncharacterized protein LOC110443733 isoform X2 [Mizuhopecten yessoensis]